MRTITKQYLSIIRNLKGFKVCVRPETTNCKNKNEETKHNNKVPKSTKISASLSQQVDKLNKIALTTFGEAPDHCPAQDSGEVVHLPHENNCSLFYKCDAGKKVLHQCPPGLHFNPILEVCDLPQHANCTSKPNNGVDGNQDITSTASTPVTTRRPSSTASDDVPNKCPAHDSGEVVHLPHETNCSLFYKCHEGNKVLHQCPPGLHFNPILEVCDLPQHANCTSKPNNGVDGNQDITSTASTPVTTRRPSSTASDDVPNKCPAHDSGEVVHLPHETNCSLFYKCDEGNKVLHQCPPGLHFNPILEVCDLPQHANCTSKPNNGVDGNQDITSTASTPVTTRRPSSTASDDVPNKCPAHDSGEVVHLPHETNCSLFYKCHEGNKVLHQCPPGLHFNPILEVCDLPQHANCTSKPNNGVDGNQDITSTASTPVTTRRPSSTASDDVPNKCPAHDSGEVVHLPHETNCSLFYKCHEGNKVLHQCPPGLHFNPILEVCDLPQHANCTSKPNNGVDGNQDITSTASTPVTTRRPSSTASDDVPNKCPAHDSGKVVHLPHETDCSLFYKCDKGEKILHQCPPGLHFNSRLQICDLPQHANCTSKPNNGVDGNQDITSTASTPVTTRRPSSTASDDVPNKCPAHDSGEVVHLPHETNCSLFYKCDEGNKVLHQCPPGLHFNPILEVCDLPQHANCTSKPNNGVDGNQDITSTASTPVTTRRPSSTASDDVPNKCPAHDSGEVVHLPHETNCSLFYKCHEGNKVLHQCPPGLHFNPILEVCDLPQHANCTSKPNNGVDGNQDITSTASTPVTTRRPSSTASDDVPNKCPAHDSGKVVHLPHETDCSLFYKCDKGEKILHQCPPGLHFNSRLQICDLPENAKCKTKLVDGVDDQGLVEDIEQISSNSGRAPTECPPDNHNKLVHLPHETNCSLFYKCDKGKKILHQCPPTLHFNPRLQICDLPENAKCKTKLVDGVDDQGLVEDIEQISSNSGRAPTECPPDNHNKLVHLPHETNCSLFYKCDKGKKILHQCPPTLHFNSRLQICDLPENAKCKNKLVDEVDDDFEDISKDLVIEPIRRDCPSYNFGEAINLPHEFNCSLFYKCDDGRKIPLQCPSGLHFNPVSQVCDFRENVNCMNE